MILRTELRRVTQHRGERHVRKRDAAVPPAFMPQIKRSRMELKVTLLISLVA